MMFLCLVELKYTPLYLKCNSIRIFIFDSFITDTILTYLYGMIIEMIYTLIGATNYLAGVQYDLPTIQAQAYIDASLAKIPDEGGGSASPDLGTDLAVGVSPVFTDLYVLPSSGLGWASLNYAVETGFGAGSAVLDTTWVAGHLGTVTLAATSTTTRRGKAMGLYTTGGTNILVGSTFRTCFMVLSNDTDIEVGFSNLKQPGSNLAEGAFWKKDAGSLNFYPSLVGTTQIPVTGTPAVLELDAWYTTVVTATADGASFGLYKDGIMVMEETIVNLDLNMAITQYSPIVGANAGTNVAINLMTVDYMMFLPDQTALIPR
jgi:hypothetical protein